MIVSMILVFREVLEAGLIVGIILAATAGVAGRARWIGGGIGAGAAGAGIVAIFAAALSEAFQGAGQEVFTATILGFAVLMLTWHVAWMASHGRKMAADMRQIGQEVKLGQRSLLALSIVVAVAVLREGAEVVLFLFGLAAGSNTGAVPLVSGGLAGLVLACATSWLLYRGLVAIPIHRLFTITNWLIALMAAGMAGQAASILHSADLLPAWGEQIWDTSALLADKSLVGKGMHALIGYSARPSGIQLAAWVATITTLLVLTQVIGRSKQPRPVRNNGGSRSSSVRPLAAGMMLAGILAASGAAWADDVVNLEVRGHRFVPDRIEVPANVKFKLMVKNSDPTPEEFESASLNREKLVPAGQTVTIFLGPLAPGEHKFFGDFHQDTAKGIMVVK